MERAVVAYANYKIWHVDLKDSCNLGKLIPFSVFVQYDYLIEDFYF